MVRRILPALAAAVLPVSLLTLSAAPAHADYVPAPYSGSTHADIVSTDVDVLSQLLGGGTVSAAVGHSATDTDSEATPRTTAESANLDAAILGGTITPDALGASAPPSGTYDDTLLPVDVSPLLSVAGLHGSGEANWAGDASCVPAGTPLAASTTELASATVGALSLPLSSIPLLGLDDIDLTLAELGAVTTTGTTELVPNATDPTTNDVVSTTTATVAATELLGGLVTISVADPTLTATSDGTAGTVSYNNPVVTVAADTDNDGTDDLTVADVRVDEGGSLTIPLTLVNVADLGVDTLTASVTINVNDLDDSATSGALASGTVPSVLSVDVALGATGAIATLLGSSIASVSLALLPLTATATAPAGGVQCSLPAPVITSPADGDWTTSTPTITGTGEPGATVHVVVDGTEIGTTTVARDGSWSLPVTDALAPGQHDVVATQELGALTSAESNNPAFNVAGAPVITAPEDGSTTSDNTPVITGTGEPGAQLEVIVDGDSLGEVTVGGDGTWSLQTTSPLAAGEHTVDAVQTDAGGNTLDAEQVTFTVAIAPPAITAPEDGSSTDDTTPTIEGTGLPGATVTVVIDGDQVGTAVVGDDGTWTLELTDALACSGHTVTATQELDGLVSAASAPVDFTVTCAQGAPTPTLADTGAPSGMAALALLGLALVGAGAWLLRRRIA
jgi:LPXTG-motif cell wall-anchored protein